MTKLTVTVAALLLCSVQAQLPLVVQGEGFEVDMEPFSMRVVDVDNMEVDITSSLGLDGLDGYLGAEMQDTLPNLVGVLLHQDKTNQLYTGICVFRGPPFRSNHEIYEAQFTAMSKANTDTGLAMYLNLSSTSIFVSSNMGIPEGLDLTSSGVPNVHLGDLLDGDDDLPDDTDDLVGAGEPTDSMDEQDDAGLSTTMILAFVVSLAVLILVTTRWCYRYSYARKAAEHKTDDDEEEDDDNEEPEEFHDEEEGEEKGDKMNIPTSKLKRRPSHHRRGKTHTHHDFTNSEAPLTKTDAPTHRRFNSLSGVKGGKVSRRPSMVELLGLDEREDLN